MFDYDDYGYVIFWKGYFLRLKMDCNSVKFYDIQYMRPFVTNP